MGLASALGANSLMVAADGTPTMCGEIHTVDISKALKPKSPWDFAALPLASSGVGMSKLQLNDVERAKIAHGMLRHCSLQRAAITASRVTGLPRDNIATQSLQQTSRRLEL